MMIYKRYGNSQNVRAYNYDLTNQLINYLSTDGIDMQCIVYYIQWTVMQTPLGRASKLVLLIKMSFVEGSFNIISIKMGQDKCPL